MKKIIITLLITILLLTACQPTPEEAVVVGKGKEQINNMLDKAVTTPAPSAENDATPAPIALSYDAPERLEYTLHSELTRAEITVDINAPIILPENAPPIVSVKPKDISYEQVSSLVNLIKGERPLYHKAYIERVELKSDIQVQIDNYMWEISMCGDDPKLKDTKNAYQKRIKKLYREMEKAPSTYEEANIQPETKAKDEVFIDDDGKKHISPAPEGAFVLTEKYIGPFEITPDNYDDELYGFSVGGGYWSDDLRLNTKYDSGRIQFIRFYHPTDKGVKQKSIRTKIIPNIMNGFDFTKEEAINMAKPFVEAIDSTLCLVDVGEAVSTDFSKDDYPSYPFGYTLYYSRNYNGVDANFVEPATFNRELEQQDHYKKPYPQEYLIITVGKDGIHKIEYTSPMEVSNTLANNVELLPFEKIKEKFESHIVLNTFGSDSKIFMKIHRVELGMMRIAKPDSDEYLVIPVWDFYGGGILSSDTSTYTDEEYWDMITEFYGRSFLTINAIDGSIIDREMGY